ncbi:DEAD/DEAH box helicase domain [Trinorchestia longiramus]|nr:DEAD/DEAH box helicase domain [Trinorchestia longiramus]
MPSGPKGLILDICCRAVVYQACVCCAEHLLKACCANSEFFVQIIIIMSSKEESQPDNPPTTFKELGVVQELCDACVRVKWTTPTPIQVKAIPAALNGRDIIGLAKTGSGKTGAYAIPMLQALLAKPSKLFAVVLTPTRELAFQVKENIEALSARFGVKVVVVTGGMDFKAERAKLVEKPHVVVATPGRLLDHLKRTRGFTLDSVKYLVFDEADRILGVDLEEHMNDIIRVLPKDRRTMLFSATMNNSAQKLERASLVNPVRVKVNEAFQTVDTLQQHMKLVPEQEKITHLVWFLNKCKAHKVKENTFIIFCATRRRTMAVHITLTHLTFKSVPLFGKMLQNNRLAALHKFKSNQRNILVATDVASRGLDIEGVDWVINLDLPMSTKDYIHRVGRTARAGKLGQSITFTTQYDVMEFFALEKKLKVKMKEFPIEEEEVEILLPSVKQAERNASEELGQMEEDGFLAGTKSTKRKGSSFASSSNKRKA